jgi:hypothetical protein
MTSDERERSRLQLQSLTKALRSAYAVEQPSRSFNAEIAHLLSAIDHADAEDARDKKRP